MSLSLILNNVEWGILLTLPENIQSAARNYVTVTKEKWGTSLTMNDHCIIVQVSLKYYFCYIG